MTYYSFAKINLALDILEKEESGHHTLQTVYQQIPLFDEIMIEQLEGEGDFDVKFRGEEAKLVNPDDNTVINAIQFLNEKWSFKNSYRIIIFKKIPLGAGLGGGSSNAATVLNALNALEIMKLSYDELREIGSRIGADVPFFIEGGTALGSHFGEKIKLLPPLEELQDWNKKFKVVVIPQLRKSTKDMYSKVNLDLTGKNTKKTDAIIKALNGNNPEDVIKNLHNDFENFTESGFNEIKDALLKNGAGHVLLCGSGTAVFALSSNQFDLKALSQALPNQHILDLSQ